MSEWAFLEHGHSSTLMPIRGRLAGNDLAIDMTMAGSNYSPEPRVLHKELDHVRWIGGGSGAGKSTVARRIEGFRLLPTLVKPLLSDPRRAVWLLPTPTFRQAAVENRGRSALGFLTKTSASSVLPGPITPLDWE